MIKTNKTNRIQKIIAYSLLSFALMFTVGAGLSANFFQPTDTCYSCWGTYDSELGGYSGGCDVTSYGTQGCYQSNGRCFDVGGSCGPGLPGEA